MFWGVWDRFVTARKSMQNWPNWCRNRTSAPNKVASEFFTTNASDALHWTQISYFGVFRNVLLLDESRCKTGGTVAINVQVRQTKSHQNFSQRTHPIHSITPKTHVLVHFGPFRYCTKVDAKQDELMPLLTSSLNKVTSEFFTTNAPDPLHWTQNLCFGAFGTVLLLHES
jgi:hypothetical protein